GLEDRLRLSFGVDSRIANPFDVCRAPPSGHQRRRLSAAVFVAEDDGVGETADFSGKSAGALGFVIRQQRNVAELTYSVWAGVDDRRAPDGLKFGMLAINRGDLRLADFDAGRFRGRLLAIEFDAQAVFARPDATEHQLISELQSPGEENHILMILAVDVDRDD